MLQLDDCRIAILDTGRLIISPSDNFMETYSHRVAHQFENPDELLKALQSTQESPEHEESKAIRINEDSKEFIPHIRIPVRMGIECNASILDKVAINHVSIDSMAYADTDIMHKQLYLNIYLDENADPYGVEGVNTDIQILLGIKELEEAIAFVKKHMPLMDSLSDEDQTETYEEIEEKQRKALMSVLPRMKLCNSESLCNNCLRILDDIIKAVENPEAIIGDE